MNLVIAMKATTTVDKRMLIVRIMVITMRLVLYSGCSSPGIIMLPMPHEECYLVSLFASRYSSSFGDGTMN